MEILRSLQHFYVHISLLTNPLFRGTVKKKNIHILILKKMNKIKLLLTRMDKFPLGKPFANCFTVTAGKIPTLKDFIILNSFLKYNSERFMDSRPNNELFIRNSKKWFLLKSYLLENGFTPEDWPMLIPQKVENGKIVDDFSVLNRNQLLKLPISAVCPGKSTRHMREYTVGDILNFKMNHANNSYLIIQKKLRSLGFTDKDGEIMKLTQKKTRDYYVKKLVELRKFSLEDANRAVDLGLRAGWINF